jgi:hypothetical protein
MPAGADDEARAAANRLTGKTGSPAPAPPPPGQRDIRRDVVEDDFHRDAGSELVIRDVDDRPDQAAPGRRRAARGTTEYGASSANAGSTGGWTTIQL